MCDKPPILALVVLLSSAVLGCQTEAQRRLDNTHTYELEGFDAAPANLKNHKGTRVAVVFKEPNFKQKYVISGRRNKAAVLRMSRRVTQEGEVGIIFYSGHGAPVPGDGGVVRECLLVPYDGQTDSPEIQEQTCYSLTEFRRHVERVSGPVFVFLDTCFSGKSRAV